MQAMPKSCSLTQCLEFPQERKSVWTDGSDKRHYPLCSDHHTPCWERSGRDIILYLQNSVMIEWKLLLLLCFHGRERDNNFLFQSYSEGFRERG